MSRDTARHTSPLSLLILLLVLLFGAVQLYFWTDRSIWIDEVSQLLNVPLDSLAQAFGPLPYAQQAAPPVFNLLLHAMSGLTIPAMRVVMVGLTLAIIAIAYLGAFDRRPLPIAAGLFVLLSHVPFLINATMLKFYAFDIAGFAIFACWIYAKDRDEALGLRDVAILLVGLLIGVSTIVGACVVVAVFLALRLGRTRLAAKEIGLAGIVLVVAAGYYLQISHATEIQITAFPDAYGRFGAAAVMKFFEAALQILGMKGAVLLLLVFAIALGALVMLEGAARSRLAGLVLFSVTILIVFLGLAAVGKYPAVSPRHLVWILGLFGVLAGALVDALSRPRAPSRLATGALFLMAFVFAASGARVAAKWPPQVVEGASDQIVATLAGLPPSPVRLYFGTFRLVPLMLERGAPIGQHDYAPELTARSGAIDPSYFGPEWQEMEPEVFSERIEDMLRNDPLGWAKMYIILRLRGDFRPLARFVLDAAPTDGSPFYITAIHASWTHPAPATLGLLQVLDERSCDYEAVGTYDTLLSPGYILKARCPAPR